MMYRQIISLSYLSICKVILTEICATHNEAVVKNVNFAMLQTNDLVELGRKQPLEPASELRRLVKCQPTPVTLRVREAVMERPQEAGRGLAPDTPGAATPVQEDPDPEAGPGGQRGRNRVPQPPLPVLHAPVEGGHYHPLLGRLRPRHQLLGVDVMSYCHIIKHHLMSLVT